MRVARDRFRGSSTSSSSMRDIRSVVRSRTRPLRSAGVTSSPGSGGWGPATRPGGSGGGWKAAAGGEGAGGEGGDGEAAGGEAGGGAGRPAGKPAAGYG